MRFLVDEDLPRSTKILLQQQGYEAVDVRDIGLRGASDAIIIAYAQTHGLCLLSSDLGFADIRNYPPAKYSGIVILRLPAKATSSTILTLLEKILLQTEIISQLSGKLAIVESDRVRIRKG
jgi:predicted nuclease of predicted toxin-antitoxin system